MRDKNTPNEQPTTATDRSESPGLIPTLSNDQLRTSLPRDSCARTDDWVAVSVAAAMVKYDKEIDDRLSHVLAAAEERHERHCSALRDRLAKAEAMARAQEHQLKTLSTELKAVHARPDCASSPVDASKMVNCVEARFDAALAAAECRFNEALTAVKVDTAHQLQAAQNTASIALQEIQERYTQTDQPVSQSPGPPSIPAPHAPSQMTAASKQLDDLEKHFRDLKTEVSTRAPRNEAAVWEKLLALSTRISLLERRVTKAESRVAQVVKTPFAPQGSTAAEKKQTPESTMEELSQRVLAVELSRNKAIKEQQQLGKRLQALSSTAGRNNVSLMKAQQTLGERLRLLEDMVTANSGDKARDINELRTKLEELNRVIETLPPPQAIASAPTRAASTDLPIALMMEDLFEMVEKHEAFFDLYADRVIAVALAVGGGKISDLTPSGIEAVQTCLRDVKRLSTLKTGDVAQHYINRLERKKTKAERSENREAAKGNKVERSGEDTAKPQGVRTAEETEASKVIDKAQDVKLAEEDKAGSFGCASVQ